MRLRYNDMEYGIELTAGRFDGATRILSEDGIIEECERPTFQTILDSLEKISNNATALRLWALKNIRIRE